MNNLSDIDLVKLCKKNDKRAMETLYLRYIPFINKKYTKFKRTFSSIGLERADFQNDCYFQFCKAVNYINFDKITKPETWKFLGAFMLYIDSYIWETVRQFDRKEVKDTPLFVTNDEGDEVILTDLIPSLAHEDNCLETAYETQVLKTFYESLTPFETLVLRQRADIREKGKPKQLTEIATALNTNFSKIQSTCKSIENKFKKAAVY